MSGAEGRRGASRQSRAPSAGLDVANECKLAAAGLASQVPRATFASRRLGFTGAARFSGPHYKANRRHTSQRQHSSPFNIIIFPVLAPQLAGVFACAACISFHSRASSSFGRSLVRSRCISKSAYTHKHSPLSSDQLLPSVIGDFQQNSSL